MAINDEERKDLGDAVEALGAITLVVGAALTVLNAEVPDFKRKLLATIAGARMSYPFGLTRDAPKLLAMARQFVDLLQDSPPLQ